MPQAAISKNSIAAIIQAHHGAAQAALVGRLRSIDQAEDALQEAIVRALVNWPKQGVPDNVVAWLVTTGLNYFRDEYRKQSRYQLIPESSADSIATTQAVRDDGRLRRVRDDLAQGVQPFRAVDVALLDRPAAPSRHSPCNEARKAHRPTIAAKTPIPTTSAPVR